MVNRSGIYMKLNKYFNREEFECSCGCGFNTVDAELISVLTSIRIYFDKPVTINSGARCTAHNSDIGGSITSQHLIGRAADIVVKDVDPKDVQDYLRRLCPERYGIGNYDTFTHIDTRSTKARW